MIQAVIKFPPKGVFVLSGGLRRYAQVLSRSNIYLDVAEKDCSFFLFMFLHFLVICHTVLMHLCLPHSFIRQTEGLFNTRSTNCEWLKNTKRDWDEGWGRVEEDRGRSVREGTKTTPSDCRWLFQSLAWAWALAEDSAGLFAVDTSKAFIEQMMMLKWS